MERNSLKGIFYIVISPLSVQNFSLITCTVQASSKKYQIEKKNVFNFTQDCESETSNIVVNLHVLKSTFNVNERHAISDVFHITLYRKYSILRPKFSQSCRYANGQYANQVVDINKINTSREIASHLKLPHLEDYMDYCFRRFCIGNIYRRFY